MARTELVNQAFRGPLPGSGYGRISQVGSATSEDLPPLIFRQVALLFVRVIPLRRLPIRVKPLAELRQFLG